MDELHDSDFLWPEERKLLHSMIADQCLLGMTLRKGLSRKSVEILPGIYDEVCKMIKVKIDTGIYEPSNLSYRSRWFCVVKKDGKSLRIVHSLEPLNAVTLLPIQDYHQQQRNLQSNSWDTLVEEFVIYT